MDPPSRRNLSRVEGEWNWTNVPYPESGNRTRCRSVELPFGPSSPSSMAGSMPGSQVEDVAPSRRPATRPGQPLLLFVAVGIIYYLGARIGFLLRFPPATTSVIWPPNALLTAVLLLTPPGRWWLYVLLAALPAHLLVELQAGFPLQLVFALFATNCLEAVVA